ncbi:MAG: hypothetical protein JSS76_06630 [Bacteroidetes bacterium]|nr:hypothetical protein [Bacteroidota bacterium]
MASLNISETQFAFNFFAKFNQLYNFSFNRVIVPSTVLEGTDDYEYNGTDLVLDDFFFQFKMSEILTRTSANESDDLNVPYFRFDVKNLPTIGGSATRGQLDFLIAHANAPGQNNKVYYVSPSFDPGIYSRDTSGVFWAQAFYRSAPADIDHFCAFTNIKGIDPRWVTPDDEHVICYEHGAAASYFYSDPKMLEKDTNIFSNIESTTYPSNHPVTLQSRIGQLISAIRQFSTKIEIPSEVPSHREMQTILFNYFDLLWLPIVITQDNRAKRLIKKRLE